MNNRNTTKSIVWAAVDRFGIVVLQFVINLVLARMLTPDDFGCIGMILIFVAVSQVLIDGGFGSALIQKREPTETDYSTTFYWNILLSVALYAIIYGIAPAVARFFDIAPLEELLRVIGLVIVINSFSLVQRTILRKKLDFRHIAITDIVAYMMAAMVAIYIAHRGLGAWSLVGMQLTNALMTALIFWFVSRWRPSFSFSWQSLRSLFSYGGFLLVASIMQDICTHIQGVVIGRRFSAADTGLYTQAKKMDEVASMTLPAVFCQVLFPLYSEKQNNLEELQQMLRRNNQTIAFIIFPLMMLLMVIAEPVFRLLYGQKWIDAVPYFQILCIGGFFSALYNFSYYAVAAVGRSKALFYWGCYKWGMLIILLLTGASISMTGVLVAMVISNINIYITNGLLVQRYIGYLLRRQLVDIVPVMCCTLICGTMAYILYVLLGIHWVVVSILFAALYFAVCRICKIEATENVRHSVKSLVERFR